MRVNFTNTFINKSNSLSLTHQHVYADIYTYKGSKRWL